MGSMDYYEKPAGGTAGPQANDPWPRSAMLRVNELTEYWIVAMREREQARAILAALAEEMDVPAPGYGDGVSARAWTALGGALIAKCRELKND